MFHVVRTVPALAILLLLLGTLEQAHACPMPPPPVRSLDMGRYYTDPAGTRIDPDRLAAQRRAAEPVRSWLTHVVRDADSSRRQSTPSLNVYRAKCALEWLDAWAGQGALLDTMASKQAEAERRWTLAGAALAYLKVRSHASSDQRAVIQRWLTVLASRAQAAFHAGGSKHNNHAYWLGLGLGATAIATGSDGMWRSARAILAEAMTQITGEGTLPLEMQRGSRALHYHAFAAMPLVTLAFLSEARGDMLTGDETGALDRLVRATAEGLADPEKFDGQTGIRQERPVRPGSGWLPLYDRWRGAQISDMAPEMPADHRWLGGNVLLLWALFGDGSMGP